MTKRSLVLQFLIGALSLFSLSSALDAIVPQVYLKPTNYQKWAHYHWAWLKNTDGNSESIKAMVQGFKDHNIPLGAVNIDSTWATQYNNFEVDPERFPDFPAFVKYLHDEGLKVIMWATSMVNVENPDYDMCVEKQFLVRDSHGFVRPLKWWHGSGGLLDYTNPDAVTWWHGLMDKVLDAGIDGFKCDGTDPYILEYSLTGGALGYQDQIISYHQYATLYYRDFFYYTRQKKQSIGQGQDAGLIMSRPIDCSIDSVSKLCTPFSPKDVMYAGWVGDDDASWEGMRGCLRKVFDSAYVGYANYGCDIGGYRGNSNTKDKMLFIRWAQLGAFLPLMENGGGGDHLPWLYDTQTIDIYRTYVNEHLRLSSYLYTLGAEAVERNSSVIHPVDEISVNINDDDHKIGIVFPQPSSYSYRLGDEIVIHPVMYHESNNTMPVGVVEMMFPTTTTEVGKVVWLDYFHPTDLQRSHTITTGEKQTKTSVVVPLESYAVYVRQGALLPLHDFDHKLQQANLQKVTFTWFGPLLSQTAINPVVFEVRESSSTGTGMIGRAYLNDNDEIITEITSHPGSAGWKIIGISQPMNVEIDCWKSSMCVWHYLEKEMSLLVDCQSVLGGVRVHVYGAKPTLPF